MWFGIRISKDKQVLALSAADIRYTTTLKSETVKAVSIGSVLLVTITCNPNSLQLSVNGHKSTR
jgi:hypothetical protein